MYNGIKECDAYNGIEECDVYNESEECDVYNGIECVMCTMDNGIELWC